MKQEETLIAFEGINMGNFHSMVVRIGTMTTLNGDIDIQCTGAEGIDPLIVLQGPIAKRFKKSGIQEGDAVLFFCRMRNYKLDGYSFPAKGFRKVKALKGQYKLTSKMLKEGEDA